MPIFEPQLSAGVSTVGNTAGTTGLVHDRIVFVASNNITLSQSVNNNSATISIFGATAAGDGLNRIAAGTQTAGTLATVNFANSNGITFGMSDSSQITASHNGLTTQTVQPVAISGSNGSFTFNTVSFGNLNGFSFYTSNGSVVGSYTAAGGADGVNILAAGTQTANTTGTVIFNNANGVTFGMANSSQITASHNGLTQQSTQPVALSAANGSFAFSTATFANSNGVSFSTGTQGIYATVETNYQSQGAYLTTARASNDAIGLNTALTANGVSVTANSSGLSLNFPAFLTTAAQSGHSHGNPTLNLTNINGTTNSASNGLTLSLSVPQQSIVLSGSNGSLSASAFTFGNLNGLSFYTSNGSIVGSYTDAGAGGGISAINVSAGTTSNNMSAVTFSNANGVSFGLDGSTVTASIPSIATFQSSSWGDIMGRVTSSSTSLGQNSLFVFPAPVNNPLALSCVQIPVAMTFSSSGAASVQRGYTQQFGVYTRNATNSTVLTLHYSTSYTFAGSFNSNTSCAVSAISAIGNSTSYNSFNSTSTNGVGLSSLVHGLRHLILPWNTTLTAGDYWIGMVNSTSSVGAAGSIAFSHLCMHSTSGNRIGQAINSTNHGINRNLFHGLYSTTTGAMPNAISQTMLNQIAFNPIVFGFNGVTE